MLSSLMTNCPFPFMTVSMMHFLLMQEDSRDPWGALADFRRMDLLRVDLHRVDLHRVDLHRGHVRVRTPLLAPQLRSRQSRLQQLPPARQSALHLMLRSLGDSFLWGPRVAFQRAGG